jgi:hypothetical protein
MNRLIQMIQKNQMNHFHLMYLKSHLYRLHQKNQMNRMNLLYLLGQEHLQGSYTMRNMIQILLH